MNDYNMQAYDEILAWKREILKPAGLLNRWSKKVQTRINRYYPEKVQNAITVTIKNMVKVVLTGSHLTTRKHRNEGMSLKEKDQKVREKNRRLPQNSCCRRRRDRGRRLVARTGGFSLAAGNQNQVPF